MANHVDQVRSLMGQAESLGKDRAALSLLEEAIRIADLHSDVELGLEVRQPYMLLARQLLRGDLLTVAFSWVVAHYDRDPERFSEYNPLWQYRWVIGLLCNLPQFGRQQIDDLFDDMIRRYRGAGLSLRPVDVLIRSIAQDFGDRAMAITAHNRIGQSPRDSMSYSTGVELAYEIEYLLFIGDEAAALQRGEIFLKDAKSGRAKDPEVCASLLLPLARAGRLAEASRLQRRIAKVLKPDTVYYWTYGEHLKFLALADRLTAAVKLYQPFQTAALRNTDPLTQLHFFLDAIPLFDRLLAHGKMELRATLPAAVPVPQAAGRYSVPQLHEWINQRAQELANQFDTRNGNTYFNDQLGQRHELRPF